MNPNDKPPPRGHNQQPKEVKPIRCFQKYTPEQRANHAASRRLGYQQRQAIGEYFWVHPLIPDLAFHSRKAALNAARERGLII